MTGDILEPGQVSDEKTNPEINKIEQPHTKHDDSWDKPSITDNTNENFNGEAEQFAKLDPKTNAKMAKQEDDIWLETDVRETKLPVDGQDDCYQLIKQCLFLDDVGLVDDRKHLQRLIGEWLIQARYSESNKESEKLNKELLHIVNDYVNGHVTPKLQRFLESNSPDLKAVLDLKRDTSELTLLHVLPITLRPHVFDNYTLMGCLLKAGANPNTQDSKGRTPLHCAVDCYQYGFVDLLVEHKAELDKRDFEGKTSLHYAAVYGEKECINFLISKGANYGIQDKDGKTPLQIAIDSNNYDVVECFFNKKQKKLNKELYRMVEGTRSKLGDDCNYYNNQGVEDLKKFLDEHKNNEDLKMILSIKDEEGNFKMPGDDMYAIEVINLLSAAVATDPKKLSCNREKHLPESRSLWDNLTPNQKRNPNKFFNKISGAQNMDQLEEFVNEAIRSGIRFKFPIYSDKTSYKGVCNFTDCVMKKISELKKNSKVTSSIVCKLVSIGAVFNTVGMDIINTLESEFKDHKTNMEEAYDKYVNNTSEFMKFAKSATSGRVKSAKMDNSTFYLEYSEDSIINVAKITDGARYLGLTHGSIGYERDIIKIGKSEVEIVTEKGIRDYTDLADNSNVVLTFYTNLGGLEVNLYPDKQDKDRIIVEVSNKKEILEKFKNYEEELGKNCSFGGCSVYDAIEQGYFKRSRHFQHSEAIRSSLDEPLVTNHVSGIELRENGVG